MSAKHQTRHQAASAWPTDQPPGRRFWPAHAVPDPDELTAGNAGFEMTEDPATPQERAEYQRGWRIGMGSGLVGGILLGVVATFAALWLGLQAGLAAP